MTGVTEWYCEFGRAIILRVENPNLYYVTKTKRVFDTPDFFGQFFQQKISVVAM